jgi:hypothetical protein
MYTISHYPWQKVMSNYRFACDRTFGAFISANLTNWLNVEGQDLILSIQDWNF